ncbi:MAG: hypothetical protein K0S38_66 [Candidatus Paceibacter sp.]|jgi:hypothetical protein|nr:hypothetical protein [Candidatus Paceibacter sp.]
MAKKWAVFFGIIFMVIGILGFIPTNGIFGKDAIFVTDLRHSIIQLCISIILIIAARSVFASVLWLKLWGIFYMVLFINGLFNAEKLLGFITANPNDIWLHFGLGVLLLAAGFMSKSQPIIVVDKATL